MIQDSMHSARAELCDRFYFKDHAGEAARVRWETLPGAPEAGRQRSFVVARRSATSWTTRRFGPSRPCSPGPCGLAGANLV